MCLNKLSLTDVIIMIYVSTKVMSMKVGWQIIVYVFIIKFKLLNFKNVL